MKEIGIYIHIPFCKQKCKYCDFVSFSDMEDNIEEYVNCILKEIKEFANENIYKSIDENIKESTKENIGKEFKVNTIYFGGGTPSIIHEMYIEKILNHIKNNFNLSKECEITIEINPGTVNKNKLKKYFEIGINRLSIGLQSTNNELLKMLGRIHTFEEFEEIYELSRKIGFKNINVDLMIGLPNQTISMLEKSLEEILKKSPEHISVYSLIVEDGTQMYELINNGQLKLPNENIERKMYWKVKKKLEEHEYNHYEISNFAKKGFESKHNINCWNQNEYIGFGISAHSYYNGIRYCNISNLEKYIINLKNNCSINNKIFNEIQNENMKMKEYMLLGLRKIEGVQISNFKNKFVKNPLYVFRNELNKLVIEDLIKIDENNIKLTKKGLDLANQVWIEFV